MYKIETSLEDNSAIHCSNMEIGDIGIHRGQRYATHIILRTYTGYISLTDPQGNWKEGADFKVKLLPPGTIITITI